MLSIVLWSLNKLRNVICQIFITFSNLFCLLVLILFFRAKFFKIVFSPLSYLPAIWYFTFMIVFYLSSIIITGFLIISGGIKVNKFA